MVAKIAEPDQGDAPATINAGFTTHPRVPVDSRAARRVDSAATLLPASRTDSATVAMPGTGISMRKEIEREEGEEGGAVEATQGRGDMTGTGLGGEGVGAVGSTPLLHPSPPMVRY